MILLDTNVLSELMLSEPNPRVVQWLDNHPDTEIWICSVTVAEIRLGIALLPQGKRRQAWHAATEQMLEEDFADRCLPFDCQAAAHYARIVAMRKLKKGQSCAAGSFARSSCFELHCSCSAFSTFPFQTRNRSLQLITFLIPLLSSALHPATQTLPKY